MDASGGGATSQRINIITTGYYYFDGAAWVKVSTGITADNGLTMSTASNVHLGGPLSKDTEIVTAGFNTGFTGTGRLGVGIMSPARILDVEGSFRLSETHTANIPAVVNSSKPLLVNPSDGQVIISPKGYTTISGGFRPGNNVLIATLPVSNTICRVRFIHHVDESNDTNNSLSAAYTYGDLTIIGMGNGSPIRIIEANIKNSAGAAKA